MIWLIKIQCQLFSHDCIILFFYHSRLNLFSGLIHTTYFHHQSPTIWMCLEKWAKEKCHTECNAGSIHFGLKWPCRLPYEEIYLWCSFLPIKTKQKRRWMHFTSLPNCLLEKTLLWDILRFTLSFFPPFLLPLVLLHNPLPSMSSLLKE